jgi:hypothetical protein
MKKSLLTLGAVVALAAGASAQGTLGIFNASSAGFNTVTSNPGDPGNNWYTGSLNLSIYTLAASGNANAASTINADEQSLASVVAGVNLITSGWTLQNIGIGGGAQSANSLLAITGGLISGASEATYTVGSSGTLAPTASIYYALVFTGGTGGVEGAVVLNNVAGYTPGTATAEDEAPALWPGNQQNVLLAPATVTPEPTSIALAGLGGLSMLFLRRRKA